MMKRRNLIKTAICIALITCLFVLAKAADNILDMNNVKGGLVVHVGCGDGKATIELKKSEAYIVHGLDTDPASIRKAREYILAGNYNGSISAALFDGKNLPYIDNMVNFILCSKKYKVSDNEILRVLCPGGKAIIQEGGKQRTLSKARPDNYDEWNHYLHDADNNAVSKDTVITAPIKHVQWKGSPMYSRHHDKSSSIPAVVSAGGKVFYIVDNGPRASVLWAPKWQLIARDAFNGVILWQKEIEQWTDHLAYGLKSGPAVNPRRLVAIKDHVYVTLGVFAPVSKLDSHTGKVLKTYKGTEKTEEILVQDGILYLIIYPSVSEKSPGKFWIQEPKKVMAVKGTDGTILWHKELSWIAPCTLTIGRNNVYLCNGPQIIAYNQKTGKELWKSQDLPWREEMPTYFAPTLVAIPGGVLYVGGEDFKEHAGSKGLMTCLNESTGKIKWQVPHLPSGYQSPQDIFVIKGRAWSGSLNSKPGEFDKKYPEEAPSTGEYISYNLETGKPDRTLKGNDDAYWFHHRCHRAKATENYFLTSRTGIEMIDNRTGKWSLHHWIRGACVYGIMPANGLIYGPPHPCACYPEAKLKGFNAVSGSRDNDNSTELSKSARLKKGPAYKDSLANKNKQASDDSDWPTFRGNPARSGSSTTPVKTDLKPQWEIKIDGKLSQPVTAEGKIFVAAVDKHTLFAIDKNSGKLAWKYIAGGRIDSPPTYYKGMLLFGCVDGYVYSVQADDGKLAWKFRAASYDQRIMVYEQLESVWPVHGSVLVRDDVAYVIAGRSMFLDGGLTLYRLDPLSGNVLSTEKMNEKDPNTGKEFHSYVTKLDMPVASSDILSSEGDYLFMRSQPFNLKGKRARVEHVNIKKQKGPEAHLFVPNGFLDDNWWHRAFWVYGRSVTGGPGYHATGRATPSGKMMVLDKDNMYIFGRDQKYWKWTVSTEYRVFSVSRDLPPFENDPSQNQPGDISKKKGKKKKKKKPKQAFANRWSVKIPVLVRAMVKAGETLFMAGPEDIVDEESLKDKKTNPNSKGAAYDINPQAQDQLKEQADLFAGKNGSRLWAISAIDGSKIKELKLDVLPVFDGMIAADGRIYMSTVDGKVVCLGSK